MSVGDQSYINKYINMSLHEFATRSKHYGVQMYENVVNTDRIVFSELRQTDNDWDFEDMEVLQVKMSQRKVVNTMYVCFKTRW